ncbi:peptide deformylase [Desulfoscipio geothermicus]|uniref:Peptide deformylase n=1 Tax=Desulfoscipio geothermicus DSM 3669 TaxID=1121426 RepID=A0A1I6DJ83_9FIRM|nr:peptide deformylase [Desulfoscipio geothermicus]SFR05523.1 peptide deformylase [Desulfoscipio geothermicus DSM 3669]
MAIYKIVEAGDDVLRETARRVTKLGSNIDKLLDNMRDTMYANKGVGLAAPQIGISKRVIVVDVGEGLVELVNPEIVDAQGSQTDTEGCLSIPGVVGEVTRAERVQVSGLDRKGNNVEIDARGFFARALQHEIDHLNGILFIDKANNLKKVQ